MHGTTRVHTSGFSLVELTFTLVLLAILASLAAPAMSGYIKQTQMRSTLDQLASDIFYARMLAVREGHGVELRISHDDGCIDQYEIVIMTASPRRAKIISVQDEARGLCVQGNASTDMRFDSHGFPRGSFRSFWIHHGAMADSVRMSAAGRITRTR